MTVQRVNRFAQTGLDEDFGRGSAPYGRYYGDQGLSPNPNLAPPDEPPFYALKVYPGAGSTLAPAMTFGMLAVRHCLEEAS